MTLSRVNKLYCAQLAAKTIGILVSLCGLFLLGMFIVSLVVAIADGWFELSVDGFLSSLGLLVIAGMGLYFIWIGFRILVLKRISATSFILLTVIPAIFLSAEGICLIKTFWEKPAEGYGFISFAFLATITMVVFVSSYALSLKVFLSIFRKGGYC